MTYPKMASFYFKAASEQDEEKQVERMQQALRLTDEEWRYIISVAANEYDCNENETALSVLKKISGVSTNGPDKALTGAIRFFDGYREVREKNETGPVGKLLTPAGFDIAHTGGGIYLWHKDIADGHFLYLSGGDGDLGEKINEAFGVGVYTADGEQVGWYESIDLHDALLKVAQCERDVSGFIKKYPFN